MTTLLSFDNIKNFFTIILQVKKFLLDQVTANYCQVKDICYLWKVWISMFLFSSCYQIPQLYCKFKILAVSAWLAGEIHTNNFRDRFFHTNKCKCMSLNVRVELPICERTGHVFPYLISNPDLFRNCSISVGAQKLASSKICFLYTH